jgi:hypothetical protein
MPEQSEQFRTKEYAMALLDDRVAVVVNDVGAALSGDGREETPAGVNTLNG